jgi:G3E family GTPase
MMETQRSASAAIKDGRSPVKQIPVALLTGFLGSGKTTLLRRLLTLPEFADTAVLVNELGAVGLDHHLMWQADGATVVLENGCICCSVRADLVASLEDLFWKRLHRQIPRFGRVVIETTGLADPGPIINELFSDPFISERFRLDSVLCTVDAVFGERHLDMHPESLAQAGAADAIFITKTDISAPDAVPVLEGRLRQINPLAKIQCTSADNAALDFLQSVIAFPESEERFRTALLSAGSTLGQPPELHRSTVKDALSGQARYAYHHRVHSNAIRFDRPWQLDDFERCLRTALDRWGDCVLRIKGMITVAGESDPVIVQVVQKMIFPFERMASLPEGSAANFIVCITLGSEATALSQYFHLHAGNPAKGNMAG